MPPILLLEDNELNRAMRARRLALDDAEVVARLNPPLPAIPVA